MKSQRAQIDHRRQFLRDKLRRLCLSPLMRGSIVERVRRCGRSECACAHERKARHPGKYLSVHLEGRTHVVHVRPQDEQGVRQAIDAYGEMWATITTLTALEVADLRRAARERRRARRGRRP